MTVYKKGNSKKWTAHVSWTGSDGKRQQKTKGGFRTKHDATMFEYGLLNYVKYNNDNPESIDKFLSGYIRNGSGNLVKQPHLRVKPAYFGWDRSLMWEEPREEPILTGEDAYSLLRKWQDYRCAMCGIEGESLVLDHCHETGLVRGFLCNGCNMTEGREGEDHHYWSIYRKVPPAKILKIKIYYNEFGRSPYPRQSQIDKNIIDTDIDEWGNQLCYELIRGFCDYRISLDWASSSQMRLLVRNAIMHIKEQNHKIPVSAVDIDNERVRNILSQMYVNHEEKID